MGLSVQSLSLTLMAGGAAVVDVRTDEKYTYKQGMNGRSERYGGCQPRKKDTGARTAACLKLIVQVTSSFFRVLM